MIMRLGTSKNMVHLHSKEGDNLYQNSESCHCGAVLLTCWLLLSMAMSSSSTKSTWSRTRNLQFHKDELILKYPKTLTLLDIGAPLSSLTPALEFNLEEPVISKSESKFIQLAFYNSVSCRISCMCVC